MKNYSANEQFRNERSKHIRLVPKMVERLPWDASGPLPQAAKLAAA